jgi:branched-chain amino acid transport system permease protein
VDTFLQLTVDALTQGSVYALIALGYTLVYGVLKLLNFAHGDVFMVGSFMASASCNCSAVRPIRSFRSGCC